MADVQESPWESVPPSLPLWVTPGPLQRGQPHGFRSLQSLLETQHRSARYCPMGRQERWGRSHLGAPLPVFFPLQPLPPPFHCGLHVIWQTASCCITLTASQLMSALFKAMFVHVASKLGHKLDAHRHMKGLNCLKTEKYGPSKRTQNINFPGSTRLKWFQLN